MQHFRHTLSSLVAALLKHSVKPILIAERCERKRDVAFRFVPTLWNYLKAAVTLMQVARFLLTFFFILAVLCLVQICRDQNYCLVDILLATSTAYHLCSKVFRVCMLLFVVPVWKLLYFNEKFIAYLVMVSMHGFVVYCQRNSRTRVGPYWSLETFGHWFKRWLPAGDLEKYIDS